MAKSNSAVIKPTNIKPTATTTSLLSSGAAAVAAYKPSTANTVVPAPQTSAGQFNEGATVTRPEVTSSDPYIKTGEEATQGYYDAYMARRQGLIDAAKEQYNSTNTAYDTSAKNTYGNYLEALKKAKTTASDFGMTGGAVERMKVDSANNYNRGYSANEAGRLKALAGIQTQYNADANNALVDYYNNANNTMTSARMAYQQYADQKAADDAARQLEQDKLAQEKALESARLAYEKETNTLNTYISTVGRFDTTSKCNKEIKRLKNSNDPLKSQKIQAVKAQLAVVKALKKGK